METAVQTAFSAEDSISGINSNYVLSGTVFARISLINRMLVIFERTNANWTEVQKISQASVPGFGKSIALFGNSIIVGCVANTPTPGQLGSVYVFFKNETGSGNDTRWRNSQILTVDEDTIVNSPTKASFGYSCSISGDYIAVVCV